MPSTRPGENADACGGNPREHIDGIADHDDEAARARQLAANAAHDGGVVAQKLQPGLVWLAAATGGDHDRVRVTHLSHGAPTNPRGRIERRTVRQVHGLALRQPGPGIREQQLRGKTAV